MVDLCKYICFTKPEEMKSVTSESLVDKLLILSVSVVDIFIDKDA